MSNRNGSTHEASGDAGHGSDPVLRLHRDMAHIQHSPGWAVIRETAGGTQPPGQRSASLLANLHRGMRSARPVRAATVERHLQGLDPQEREMREFIIRNTVGFARNVLDAEAITHSRASTAAYFEADITPSGPHMLVKGRAAQSAKKHHQVQEAAAGVNTNRMGLPIKRPDGIALNPEDQTKFYAMAELYGMARADFSPSDLVWYLATADVRGVNQRTRELLGNSSEIATYLDGEQSPVDGLAAMGVNLPAAIEIADAPTKATIFSVANRLAQVQQTPALV